MCPDDSTDSPLEDRPTESTRADRGHPGQHVRVQPAVIGRTLSAVGGVVATIGGLLVLVGLLVALARVLFAYEPIIGVGLAVLVGGAILLAAGELVRDTVEDDGIDHRLES